MSGQERWLLPEGIEEVLPDEARHLEAMRRQVLDLFASWGYEPVMPPMIEFLDALQTGVGQELDLQTFKLTDQLSGRLIGVRADMTPQTARIDAHYLKRQGPARLCYVGPSLRTRPDEFAGSRELLQLGAELFGHSGAESDAEVLCLMAATLKAVGIKEFHIDLGHVGIFRGLAKFARLDTTQESMLFEAMQRKAEGEIRQMLEQWQITESTKTMLLSLIDLNGNSDVLELASASLAKAPDDIGRALNELSQVARKVIKVLPEQSIYFDLAELSGYGYHTGVVFSAFISGQGRAIANGGRYDGVGKAFGRSRPATGFGADLRQLVRISMEKAPLLKGILAPYEDDGALRELVGKLRKEGRRVVNTLPGQDVIPDELGCDQELVKVNGSWEIKTLKIKALKE